MTTCIITYVDLTFMLYCMHIETLVTCAVLVTGMLHTLQVSKCHVMCMLEKCV